MYDGARCPTVLTDLETAELTKYVTNAMLAARVALVNEIANLCAPLGVHVDEVMAGVGLDPRIGPLFLDAGCGFGGSCFPKDVSALVALGRQLGAPLSILETSLRSNDAQPLRLVAMAERALGSLQGARVALLGLAFKPGTDDVRGTRALPIHRALVAAGAEVVCHDPRAGPTFLELAAGAAHVVDDVADALGGADAAILQCAWPDYRKIPPETFTSRMRRPVVVDGRRGLDAAALRRHGVLYEAVGEGRIGHESGHPGSRARDALPAVHQERA